MKQFSIALFIWALLFASTSLVFAETLTLSDTNTSKSKTALYFPTNGWYKGKNIFFDVDEKGFRVVFDKPQARYFDYTHDFTLRHRTDLGYGKSWLLLRAQSDLLIQSATFYTIEAGKKSQWLQNLDYRGSHGTSLAERVVKKILPVGENYLIAMQIEHGLVLTWVNKNYRMIMQREYVFSYFEGRFRDMTLLDDGTLLVVGELYSAYKNFRGLIMHLDLNLNVLHSKVYTEYGRFGDIERLDAHTVLMRYENMDGSGVVSYDLKERRMTSLSKVAGMYASGMAFDGEDVVEVGYTRKKLKGESSYFPTLSCYHLKTQKNVITILDKEGDAFKNIISYKKRFYLLYKDAHSPYRDGNIKLVTVAPKSCQIEEVLK